MIEPSEILFLGLGATPLCWYRCALPAMNIGADWCGIKPDTAPPNTIMLTGLVRHDTRPPDMDDYKVIIVQQVAGPDWLRFIEKSRAQGKTVLYEIDDFLHGVSKVASHDWQKHSAFAPAGLRRYELCMRACDGIIVSTEYLGRHYRKFNDRIYVCQNGLDVARYNLTIPERSSVNIGWAGATGHTKPVVQWMNGAVIPTMNKHGNVCFVGVGNSAIAGFVQRIFGAERAIGTPFTQIETYPAAMTMIDVAIAPVGKQPWYRSKSDLRFLEAGALGIPLVADPAVYKSIEHGVTGFHATSPSEARDILFTLVEDQELRHRVGEAAREYVNSERNAAVASLAWLEVCRAAAGDFDSMQLLAADR